MSVTAPLGFRAAGVAAGLKPSGARDVAVVVNDGPSRAAAGLFTANRVKAAPVQWTQQVTRGGRVRAVLLNSGGANACTGPSGFTDTHTSAEHLAAALADSAGEMAICSTGLIGERLPMDRLLAGADAAVGEASRVGGPGGRRRHQDHGHRCQDRLPARRRLHDRGHGQGRGHDRPRARHHALRPHHRRRPRPGRP
jgi:glutamate N-acetyltransferase/amino-acid N-acetyltransferase